jgi:hypothetical protein
MFVKFLNNLKYLIMGLENKDLLTKQLEKVNILFV